VYNYLGNIEEIYRGVHKSKEGLMAKNEVCHDGSNDYFQGQTDTSIRILFDDIKEIKDRMITIDNKLDENIQWKNRVMGMSAVIAFIITLLSNKLIAVFFGA
jgi:hypothetical protein